MIRWTLSFACAICCANVLLIVPPAFAVTLEWIRQFGTINDEGASAIVADAIGSFYLAGHRGSDSGSLGDYLSKFDDSGSLVWTTEEPYSEGAGAPGTVALDGLGNVYVSGTTWFTGSQVGYLKKYDSSGAVLWARPRAYGNAAILAADGLGNVFVGYGDYVENYSADDGGLLWARQLPQYNAVNVAADGFGNVYVGGNSHSILGNGSDLYKYDSAGNLVWSAKYGDLDVVGDNLLGRGRWVSTDTLGNVYATGGINLLGEEGALFGPSVGSFLAKHDSGGNLQWFRRIDNIFNTNISADDSGNVYVRSLDIVEGIESNLLLSKYSAAGDLLWDQPLGLPFGNFSVDGVGNVYYAGGTNGSVGGPNNGGVDAFVAKFSNRVPEPASGALGVLALVGFAALNRRRAQLRLAVGTIKSAATR